MVAVLQSVPETASNTGEASNVSIALRATRFPRIEDIPFVRIRLRLFEIGTNGSSGLHELIDYASNARHRLHAERHAHGITSESKRAIANRLSV